VFCSLIVIVCPNGTLSTITVSGLIPLSCCITVATVERAFGVIISCDVFGETLALVHISPCLPSKRMCGYQVVILTLQKSQSLSPEHFGPCPHAETPSPRKNPCNKSSLVTGTDNSNIGYHRICSSSEHCRRQLQS
jgi:hypothetical protein